MQYTKHVFFCTNKKPNDKKCCFDADSCAMRDYAKQKLKEKGLFGQGKMRINNAGCLGRCQQGPTIVIYPEGVWYTYKNQQDIDEIIERHLVNGEIVSRLLMPGDG